jgi:nicotinate-nucleotide adenylyltransferase
MMRIGILGGSYNPVHHGHLRLAIEAKEMLRLDRVDLIPAALPPHKNNALMLPFGLRCRLLAKAIAGLHGLSVNPMEARRKGLSYTWDTLEELGLEMPGAHLFFLLGVPDLLTLPAWRQGLFLPRKADLVAVARQGMALEATRDFIQLHWPDALGPKRMQMPFGDAWQWQGHLTGRIILIHPPLLEISSTMIRTYWRQQRDLRFLVPQDVLREMFRQQKLLQRFWECGS